MNFISIPYDPIKNIVNTKQRLIIVKPKIVMRGIRSITNKTNKNNKK
jgi:hypothetical protein